MLIRPLQFMEGNAMSQLETRTKIKPNQQVAEPPMFKIIYINDNQTAMEFVVDSLIAHFEYTPTTAQRITMDIHEAGSAVVAILPYEVAEQKGIEITIEARGQGYPLQIKLEPDQV